MIYAFAVAKGKKPKDPHAVELGRRGGRKNTAAQKAARRRNARKMLEARWQRDQ